MALRRRYKPRKKANWEEYTSQDFSEAVKVNEELKKLLTVTRFSETGSSTSTGFLTSLFDKDPNTYLLIQSSSAPSNNSTTIDISFKRRVAIQGGLFAFNMQGGGGTGGGNVILYASDNGIDFYEVGRGTKPIGAFNEDFNIVIPELSAHTFRIAVNMTDTGYSIYLYGLDINV